jgi:hypothetical protein
MRLSRLALAAAVTALMAAPAASFASSPRPHFRAAHQSSRPTVKPARPAVARAADATLTLGGPNYLVADPQPCGSWQLVGNVWMFSCATAYFFGTEWQYTDYVHYYWTGTQQAYYGTYRCAKYKPCAWL